MKRSMFVLVFLAAAVSRAAAQEVKEELFKGIKMGDRVEITLKTEFAVRGRIVQTEVTEEGKTVYKVDPTVDLTKLTKVTLDISLEYPDLNGEMSVERLNIKSVKKLKQLTEEEAKLIEKLRKESLDATKEEDNKRRASVAKEDQTRQDEIEEAEKKKRAKEMETEAAQKRAEAEALEKAGAIYKKFPPPAWGPERNAEISKKGGLKLPISAEEQEFQKNFDLWMQYDSAIKAKKDKDKK